MSRTDMSCGIVLFSNFFVIICPSSVGYIIDCGCRLPCGVAYHVSCVSRFMFVPSPHLRRMPSCEHPFTPPENPGHGLIHSSAALSSFICCICSNRLFASSSVMENLPFMYFTASVPSISLVVFHISAFVKFHPP